MYATNNTPLYFQVCNNLERAVDVEVDLESGNVSRLNNTSNKTDNTGRRNVKSRPLRVVLRRVVVMFLLLSTLVAFGAVVWYFLGWICVVQLILVAIVAYLAAGNYKWFYVAFKTAPRDIT